MDVLYYTYKALKFVFGPVVKRLRHRPFTAVSWVRIPSGSPKRSSRAFFYCLRRCLLPQTVRFQRTFEPMEPASHLRKCHFQCRLLPCSLSSRVLKLLFLLVTKTLILSVFLLPPTALPTANRSLPFSCHLERSRKISNKKLVF